MISENHKKVLKQVVQTLKENNIPFQVSGGLAAIVYGAERTLYDIDIDVRKKDIPKVRKLFKNYIQEDFHHLQDEHFDIWLITLHIDGISVDISHAEESYFVGKDGNKIRMDADVSKAKLLNLEGINVPVEDKEELIAYKKIIARDTDLIDIEQISQSNI